MVGDHARVSGKRCAGQVVAQSTVDRELSKVIQVTTRCATQLGFRGRGLVLREIRAGNAAIVEFQRSTKSSRGVVIFTINLGVFCGVLRESNQPPPEKARTIHAHLRQRIGALLPGNQDKWWELTEGTDTDALSAEVADLVCVKAVPYLQRYLNTSELVRLWKSGQAPGLTETQRVRYLEKVRQTQE